MYGIECPPFYFPFCPVQKQWTKIKLMVNRSIIIAKLEQPVQPCCHIFLLCIFIIVMAIIILLSWWSLLENISSKLSSSNDIVIYYIDQKVPNCEVYVGKWRRIHEVAGSTWQGEHYFLTWSLGFQLNLIVLFGTHVLPMENILCKISLKKIVLKDCGLASLTILKFEE